MVMSRWTTGLLDHRRPMATKRSATAAPPAREPTVNATAPQNLDMVAKMTVMMGVVTAPTLATGATTEESPHCRLEGQGVCVLRGSTAVKISLWVSWSVLV